MGAALAAPRLALAAADRSGADGKTGSDAAALIVLVFLSANLVQVVVAGWLAVSDGFGAGLGVLGAALSRAIAFDLVALFAGAALLTLGAGRARSLGRDFDLACVAFVPYMAVKLIASLVHELADFRPSDTSTLVVRGLALGWAGLVLLMAWQQARSRQVDRT